MTDAEGVPAQLAGPEPGPREVTAVRLYLAAATLLVEDHQAPFTMAPSPDLGLLDLTLPGRDGRKVRGIEELGFTLVKLPAEV